MRRDLDVIRDLLLRAEASEHPWYPIGQYERVSHCEEDGFSLDTKLTPLELYQIDKLKDAGFILSRSDDHDFVYFEITWIGHDYLDAIRDSGVWEETKSKVRDAGGSFTLELVKKIAIALAKKKLEQHTGLEI